VICLNRQEALMWIPHKALLVVWTAACLMPAAVWSADAAPQRSRGEMLYETHCIGCHNEQVHWRDNRAATDWRSLKAQVLRWQSATGLAWRDAEVLDVAKYLNERIYHFDLTPDTDTAQGGL
jgi:mono/diheme cytochrome c family protein